MRHIICFMFALLSLATTSARSETNLFDRPLEGSGLDRDFHQDADLARYTNLVYWSGLIDEYHQINGVYPLSEVLEDGTIGLVRIAKQNHAQFYLQDSPHYDEKFDVNAEFRFQNIHVISLIRFLNRDLERAVIERYDIQHVPVDIPTWLHYFVMSDGYLLWSACDLCETSDITFTVESEAPFQTINIASPEIAATNSAFFTREDLLNHPVF